MGFSSWQREGSAVAVDGLWSTGSVAGVQGLSCSATGGVFLNQDLTLCRPALAGGFFTTEPLGKSWRCEVLATGTPGSSSQRDFRVNVLFVDSGILLCFINLLSFLVSMTTLCQMNFASSFKDLSTHYLQLC